MLETAIKHYMYEIAIDMFFERLSSNFPKQKVRPVIGQYYAKLEDVDMREVFYDCIVIPVTQLSYYDDLLSSEDEDDYDGIDEVAFGIRYKGYEDLDDPTVSERFEDYEETHFQKDELDFLIFSK